jgi:hypothetical protein
LSDTHGEKNGKEWQQEYMGHRRNGAYDVGQSLTNLTSGAGNEGDILKHAISSDDLAFRQAFESCQVPASEFDHRAHVRLAYIYLCEQFPNDAHERMKRSLLAFLRRLGIGESKYHETITRAWVMAVAHFMELSPLCRSADTFIGQNPVLLDKNIMLSHYSAEVLFSPEARTQFVEPDIQQIPKH